MAWPSSWGSFSLLIPGQSSFSLQKGKKKRTIDRLQTIIWSFSAFFFLFQRENEEILLGLQYFSFMRPLIVPKRQLRPHIEREVEAHAKISASLTGWASASSRLFEHAHPRLQTVKEAILCLFKREKEENDQANDRWCDRLITSFSFWKKKNVNEGRVDPAQETIGTQIFDLKTDKGSNLMSLDADQLSVLH